MGIRTWGGGLRLEFAASQPPAGGKNVIAIMTEVQLMPVAPQHLSFRAVGVKSHVATSPAALPSVPRVIQLIDPEHVATNER
jgi:hypothetical protein